MGYTIKDIANKLGISTAAVSKALNGKNDVSEELKERVRKTAEEMGYSPNYFAKKLATNKSGVLGVFILGREELNISEHFGFRFLEGILDSANKKGYDITLFSSSNSISYKKICEEKRVEGVIFIGLRRDNPFLEDIALIKVPVAVIDFELGSLNSVYVGSDNKVGVEKGMEYLWKMGHRKIGVLRVYKESDVGEKRYRAYREFMEKNGIYNPEFEFMGDFTKESGYLCGEKIAKMSERPSALFCLSDLMAIGVIDSLKKNSLAIPNDISILGFDNISAGEHITPGLTTIAQNAFSIGEAAVNSIITRVDSDIEVSKKIEVEPRLELRDSCKEI